MPNTKIINVLKNDDLADVMDVFENSDAQEVIFIFPRGSKFSKNGDYFDTLNDHAVAAAKKISIMTSDPVVIRCASNLGMNILEGANNPTPHPAKVPYTTLASAKINTAPVADDEDAAADLATAQDDDDDSEEEELPEETPDDEVANGIDDTTDMPISPASFLEDSDYLPDVRLAAAQKHKSNVRDILYNEGERIKIQEERKHPERIFVNVQKQSAKNVDKDISDMWGHKGRDPESKRGFAIGTRMQSSTFFKKLPFIFLGLAAVITGLIVFSVVGSADITIRPQRQNVNFQLKVTASLNAASVNTDFNRIPGQKFTQQEETSDTFPATGSKDGASKASGIITIYNKGTTSQRLVATTRFESPQGLVFRIPQSINVPAATKTGTQVTPGSIQSKVYADRPGPDYNLAPTTFTIPGFKGTPRFDDFSATSTLAMSGGSLGPSKAITEEDFNKAQAKLTETVKQKIYQSLHNQATDLTIIDSGQIQLNDPVSNAKAGDTAANLQMTIRASAKTIAFREADLKALIRNYVSKNSGLDTLDQGLKIQYKDPVLSGDENSLTFNIQVDGQATGKIDQDKIRKDIIGLKEPAIQSYFKGIKEIESVKILLSPFWIKSIPSDSQKIKLKIEN